jgi:hypothetical protein
MATIIINGGDNLKDCPKDWSEAKSIIKKLNEGNDDTDLCWKFDCGFKLDYDGGLITVCSRFYPPKTHYGLTWNGTVVIKLLSKTIEEKKFDCQTIYDLKNQVDEYIKSFVGKIQLNL